MSYFALLSMFSTPSVLYSRQSFCFGSVLNFSLLFHLFLRILGAVLVSSVDAEQGGAIKGNVAAAVSSALSGLYTVLLKKQIPTDNVDMTLFFGIALFRVFSFL